MDRTIILFLGYQGSGKTTVIKELKKLLDYVVCSGDEIREEVYANNPTLERQAASNLARKTLLDLIKSHVAQGNNIILDANLGSKLPEIVGFIDQAPQFKYKILIYYLYAPKEILLERIRSRPKITGAYQGTEQEFYTQLERIGDLEKASFNAKFDTTLLSPQEIAKAIAQEIQALEQNRP
jgi:predicted kinase